MLHYGLGHGAGIFMLLMGLFWLALVVLIVWLVIRLWPGLGRQGERPAARGPASASPVGGSEAPEKILDRMFALGEIDEATYRARRTALAEMNQPQP